MSREGPKITPLDYLTVEVFAQAVKALGPDREPEEVKIVYTEKNTGAAVKGVNRRGDGHPYTIIVKESSLPSLMKEADRYGV